MVNLPRSQNKARRIHKVKSISRSSKKRNIPRIVFWFLGLFLLLFVSFIVFESKKSLWNGKNRVNFVFNKGILFIVSLNPKDKSAIFMPLPNNLMVETAYGYGKYQIGALSKLEIQEKRKGLVNETIRENFSLGLEGWFMPKSDCEEVTTNDQIATCLKSKALQSFLKGGDGTNFARFDFLRIWWLASKIKPKDINLISLDGYKVLKESEMADGSPIQSLNRDQLQNKIDKLFWDDAIKEESLSVKVVNASFYQGAGEMAAKILENTGMEVVKVQNAEEESGGCKIDSSKRYKSSETVKKIKELFSCNFQEVKTEDEAQIVVTIGRNFGHQFLEE